MRREVFDGLYGVREFYGIHMFMNCMGSMFMAFINCISSRINEFHTISWITWKIRKFNMLMTVIIVHEFHDDYDVHEI